MYHGLRIEETVLNIKRDSKHNFMLLFLKKLKVFFCLYGLFFLFVRQVFFGWFGLVL